MSLWVWVLLLFTLIKLPLAGLFLWIPYRYDESMAEPEASDSSEEDGGTKALPGGPRNPHPRSPRPPKPRRGPHGSPRAAPPARIRTRAHSKLPVRVSH